MSKQLVDIVEAIPGIKPDISFKRDDAYTFLPRMIALVMAMVAFMLLLAISLSTALTQSSNMQRDTLLIHVPFQEKQMEIADKALSSLSDSTHIKTANIVSNDDLHEQMKPWIGNIEHAKELPVPTLIRVQLANEYLDETLQAVTNSMYTIDPSIIVDAPAQWSENYSRFSSTLQWLLFGFSIALLLGLMGLMGFVATTAMKLHKRTVVLLHSIGATDNYIAAQFQINSAQLALKGALIGSIVAAVIYAVLGIYIDSMGAAMLPSLGAKWAHLWVIIALPLISAIVGFCSGRFASLHYLKRLM